MELGASPVHLLYGALSLEKANKKEEQRSASIDRILGSAIELFVHNGYRATTVDAVAAKAKLTKGAIYFYFKTKDAIMLKLLDEAEAFVVDPVTDLMKRPKPETTATDSLVTFIHHQSMVGHYHPHHVLLLILMSIEFSGTDSEIGARVSGIYRRLYTCVEGIIGRGQKEGVFRSDIDVHNLTAIVMAAHDGVLVEWYRRPGELEGKNLARSLRSVLVAGLKPAGK
jgi:AcrR family transcriptional regulator